MIRATKGMRIAELTADNLRLTQRVDELEKEAARLRQQLGDADRANQAARMGATRANERSMFAFAQLNAIKAIAETASARTVESVDEIFEAFRQRGSRAR